MGARAPRAAGLGCRLSVAWTPFGAARADLPATAGAPPFPVDVVDAAVAQDLAPELVHLAWELARVASPVETGEGRALLLLVLATLAAQRDGSTRIPLAPPGPLEGLLATLGATADDQRVVRSLLASSERDPRISSLLGTAPPVGVAGAEGAYRPLLLAGDHLYTQRLWQLERRVVTRLRELLTAPLAAHALAVDAALADLRGRPALDAGGRPRPLGDEQEAAVRAALGGRLTAITGGPGTGKTWIVAALLRVLARLGDPPLSEVALAAPTGKAADRLQRSLRAVLAAVSDPAEADQRLLDAPPVAVTMHRLLNYSPSGERFLRHERNPLAERLVVVDESSMLDLTLAERLLRSLRDDARLVLLGDAQQLPAVDAGAVFRDLVSAAATSGRVATLTRSWRMDPSDPAGSAILELAGAIAKGNAAAPAAGPTSPGTLLAVRHDAGALAFRGAELLLAPPAPLASFLARWWQHRLERFPALLGFAAREWTAIDGLVVAAEAGDVASLFADLESTRLLTATRSWSGGTGVTALNAWFRATLLRGLDLAMPREGSRDAELPLAGEPLLVTRNDYRRGLYNGDHGLVLRVAAEGEPATAMAVLPARTRGAGGDPAFRVLPLGALRGHLEPAWASTVHKAQGSEHDEVAVILPATDTRLLTRELLYTAVTRARRSVILVGTGERLAAAAARAVERWSGIAEALRPPVGGASAPAVPDSSKKARQLPLFPE